MSLIINSIEYYLPETILTNEELQNECPEWDLDKVAENPAYIKDILLVKTKQRMIYLLKLYWSLQMRQYVKVYFQSTGDTEWAEKNKIKFFFEE